MEKKKQNPKSYKLSKRNSSSFWSELPSDLLNSVFKRLGFADSLRVEGVCSSWNSAAKRCLANKQNPWLILLPDHGDRINRHWCKLFNSEEKGKLYRIRDEGFEFTKTSCLSTYGNWLFMLDYWNDFFLLNLFTHEKIYLPPVESQRGTAIMMEQTRKGLFYNANDLTKRKFSCDNIDSPVFWIDEQTKEYVVLWGLNQHCVVYSKKGYQFWYKLQIPHVSCNGRPMMVYKDHKLYYIKKDYYGSRGFIKIFDFSGKIPQEIFQCGLPANTRPRPIDSWKLWSIKLVVTVTGHVLKVEQWVTPITGLRSFYVYKVYSSGCFKNYERVYSLGQEAMLFDLGITVLANDDIVGFKRNSIYYNVTGYDNHTTKICLFNLETLEMEETQYKFDCSSAEQWRRARWFLPSFK